MKHEHPISQTVEERLESVERVLGLRGAKPIEEMSPIEALKQYAGQLEYAQKYHSATGAAYANYGVIAADLRRIAGDMDQYGGLHVARGKRSHAA
jgi:hypothetical protein